MNGNPFESHEAMLRELVLRVAAIPGDPGAYDQQLLVGQLPEDLPVPLPLPEQSQLLGSLLRNAAPAEIILNTLLSPVQIIDFYRNHFVAMGWEESPTPQSVPLFVMVPPNEGALLNLSKAIHGPFVQVRAQSTNGASTDVRVLVYQHNRSSADFPRKTPKRVRLRLGGMSPISEMIPDLMIPPGTELEGTGFSSSLTTAQTNVILRTDLTLSSLTAFYPPQLKQAGWNLTAMGSSEHVFWSTWAVSDEANETWRGVFFVLQMPDQPGEYHLYIHLSWVGEP